MLDMWNMTKNMLLLFVDTLTIFHLKGQITLLLMTSYVVTIATYSHQTCVKMCLKQKECTSSHHITTHHIISYHIISYHIISYHIISYIIYYT